MARGKPAITVSKPQQVQFTHSNFFTNKTLSNLILFTCFPKLATAWNYFIDRWLTETSVQTSSNNFLNPKLSFPLWKLHVPTQFTLFYADKVTCNTNKATQRKTKRLSFSLTAMKFCNAMLRATPAVPSQNVFQAANQYIFGRKNPFACPPKDCALLHVDFLSR